MSYDFNAQEIFKMAEQIERNGVIFYKKAAEDATDPEAKEFLQFMAEIEDEHENVFASMRAELDAGETEATLFDPEDETILYLQALADTKVFSDDKIDTSSMHDILETAIMAEKNAIAFYVGMQDLVPGKRGKERLDAIIKEEKSHIVLLTNKLKSLS
ncbi:ferritin family protein [Desulfococcaceae bacterium HSG9]|nr:ferritin family protein [Desulfococcaceae bacterium HSG9]